MKLLPPEVTPEMLVAGVAGSLIRVVRRPPQKPLHAAAGAFGGSFCAIYLTPVVCIHLGWIDHPRLFCAAAFLTGLMGMKIIDAVMGFSLDIFSRRPPEAK
jgi:hypothetical protein